MTTRGEAILNRLAQHIHQYGDADLKNSLGWPRNYRMTDKALLVDLLKEALEDTREMKFDILGPYPRPDQEIGEQMETCDICGEPIRPNEEKAEMYDPDDDAAASLICHAQFGINNGLEVA